jgi:hypothetical protein
LIFFTLALPQQIVVTSDIFTLVTTSSVFFGKNRRGQRLLNQSVRQVLLGTTKSIDIREVELELRFARCPKDPLSEWS